MPPHFHTKGATSREMNVIARLATAEERAGEPMIRSALGDGLGLIRDQFAERGRRTEFDRQWGDAEAEPFPIDPPCPDE